MPVYEFYCQRCHTIYNFFSRRIDTTTVPDCPGAANHTLTRRVSMFTYARHASTDSGDAQDPFDDMSDSQIEQLLTGMSDEFTDLNEDDPRQMARMMRRLVDGAGVDTSEGLEEAISRMENGEDPDRIEDDLGGALDAQEPFSRKTAARSVADNPPDAAARQSLDALRRRFLPARIDATLHDLKP